MSRLSEEIAALEARLESMSADDKALDDRIRKIIKQVRVDSEVPETWNDILKLAAALGILVATIWALVALLRSMMGMPPL